ncbi:MAG: isopeptide-forming domain-containing fimbrial protein [Coprobacillus sp.]|nr:isopeptide-forming domain-containing fimbrial protein [Coprobacillus sp.]
MRYKKIVTQSLKILICFIVTLGCLIPNTKLANASTVIKPANGNLIPSDYGTSFETNTNFSMTYSNHFKDNDLTISGVTKEHYAKYVPHSYLESSSNFGKIWWQYNNAAVYNSKKINIRFTLMEWDRSWKTTLTNIDINSNNARWYLFARTKNNLGCFAPKGSRIKVSFYDSTTGNPVDVKGYMTAIDMDGLSGSGNWDVEQMTLNENINYAYIGSNLRHTGNTVYSNANGETNDSDKSVWLTLCFSGTSFTYTYNEGAFTGFTNYAVTKIEIPNPTKKVSTTSTTLGGTVNYEIRQYVPNESKDNYYTSFVITDTLSSVLEWNVNNVSIKSGNGTNVTDNFNITKTGNKLTISAKNTTLDSFYAKTYIITINTKVKNSSLAYYTTEEGTVFSNQATLTTNRGTRTSNTVKTNVLYKITTSGTNVNITDTMNDIIGGSLKTIKWTAADGYYVSKITVDDKEVEVKNLRTGTYTFSNIANNHDVKVEASPCYKIDTEIENGTITSTQNKIDPQENRTIKFSPNNGYYVSEIIVDGQAYSYEDYESEYTFNNIQENHTIKVVCEPLKTITTSITNGVITKTMTNIHPDSSKEVIYQAFEDYYISEVFVDDKKIEVNDFKNGNYKFDPVLTDHTIRVICEPKPEVTTEIVNGTISPKFKVYPHENGEVQATALNGYYINKVFVDDKEITDFERNQMNYIFNDITENHHIYVECIPKPKLEIEKTTDRDYYNYNDMVHYNIEVKQVIENTTAYNLVLKDDDITQGVDIDTNSIIISGIKDDNYTLEVKENSFVVHVKELNYDETINIGFYAKINDVGLAGKQFKNKATVICDYIDEVSSTVTNRVLKPKLSIEKTSLKEKYNLLDDLQYTIDVKQNIKGAKAFDVDIDDTITKGVKIDEDSVVVFGSEDEYTVNVNDNKLNVKLKSMSDENVQIKYNAKIKDFSVSKKDIINKATVKSKTTETEIEESDSHILIYKPILNVLKKCDKDEYNVGDTVKFSIFLTQDTKNATAYDVMLSDYDLTSGVDIDYSTLNVSGINDDRYKIEKNKNQFKITFDYIQNEKITITYNAVINDTNLAGKDINNKVLVNFLNNDSNIVSIVTRPVNKLINYPKDDIVENDPEEIIKKDDDIDVAVKGDEIVIGDIITKDPAVYKKEKTEKEIKKQIVKKIVQTDDVYDFEKYILISILAIFFIDFIIGKSKKKHI